MLKSVKKIKNKNIILTGSNGLLGNHFYKNLINSNNILRIHSNYKSDKFSYNYEEINLSIIKKFNPDYLIHFGSPTDKIKNKKYIYKKWLSNSKKLVNIFNKLEKNNLFINIGSIKELMNENNFTKKTSDSEYDLYSSYKFKFSKFLNSFKSIKMNYVNIYLLPIYGEEINSGLIYDSCKAIVEDEEFIIKSKDSKRCFLYIKDLLRGINLIMQQKNKNINNLLISPNKFDTLQNLMKKQFKKYKKINKLIFKGKNLDKFSDMTEIYIKNYPILKMNYTKFEKGYSNIIESLKKYE